MFFVIMIFFYRFVLCICYSFFNSNSLAVCDGTFFPSLVKEMSAVVGCFNKRAQKLLELHLASGFRKYFMWFQGRLQKDHAALIQEGKDLVTYALINAIAVRKILKKYDKVCLSQNKMNGLQYWIRTICFRLSSLIYLPSMVTDPLLQARTGLQVKSSKYAHWDPSVPMALWAYGFSH